MNEGGMLLKVKTENPDKNICSETGVKDVNYSVITVSNQTCFP